MATLQPIHDIAEICFQKNIEDVILCPGSRSAALTISFVRHPGIKTYSLSDERSAAFTGMGMAQQSQKTVALVCTSGSAAYNFAPAIVEAFFQEIPLLVLTADRPPEWIHQYDGQTIYQKDIYGKNIKASFELPADYSHPDAVWQIQRIVNEAINLAQAAPKGPVHINVPIREPFYPAEDESVHFDKQVKVIQNLSLEKTLGTETWIDLISIWNSCEKKLIAVGQTEGDLHALLKHFSEELLIPVVGDSISNIHRAGADFIDAHDIFMGRIPDDSLGPDLLITCGKSFISKGFKQYIRKNKPLYHWHIQENPNLIDPFQSLTHKIEVSPAYFFHKLFEDLDFLKFKEGDEEEDASYFNLWQKANILSKKVMAEFLADVNYGEFKATDLLLRKLPENSIIHLGNSMPVRYANLLGIEALKNTKVYANRGTSGIDGILSTAIGQAMKTDKIVTCLIGDVSFFYDRNALWNNYLPKNLRIVLVNNQGGNIFRIIDGPDKQPELEDYFVTSQKHTAENLAKESGFIFHAVKNMNDLEVAFETFYGNTDQGQLIEIFTDGNADAVIFQEFRNIANRKLSNL